MSNSTLFPSFRSGFYISAIAGILAVTGAPFALAQDSDEESIDEVVVTGSYIKRQLQADSASPIAILGSEDLANIGASTAETSSIRSRSIQVPRFMRTISIRVATQVPQILICADLERHQRWCCSTALDIR